MVIHKESTKLVDFYEIKQYYIHVAPISRKTKIKTLRVPKALFGDLLIPKIRKMYSHFLGPYWGNVWFITRDDIEKQLKRHNYGGVLNDSFQRSTIRSIKDIRIETDDNHRLGYRYIILEFNLDKNEIDDDSFTNVLGYLNSLQNQIVSRITRKKYPNEFTVERGKTSSITYMGVSSRYDTEQLLLSLIRLKKFPYSQLPKDPFKYGFHNLKTKNFIDHVKDMGELLYFTQLSKRNSWFLDIDTFDDSLAFRAILAGASRHSYGVSLDPSHVLLIGFSPKKAISMDFYEKFRIFDKKGESSDWEEDHVSKLRTIFNNLVLINMAKSGFLLTLSKEIETLEEEVDGIGNFIISYRKWSKPRLLRLSNRITGLLVRTMEFRNRIQAYEDVFKKESLQPSGFEFKLPPKLFPYFDYKDSEIASLNWTPHQDEYFVYKNFPEVKPLLLKELGKFEQNDLFSSQVSEYAKSDMAKYSDKLDKLLNDLNVKSKGFEQIVTGVHNERLLWFNRTVTILTAILVVLTIFKIFF